MHFFTKVHDAALTETEGIVIVDSYESSLSGMLLKVQTDRTIDMVKILREVDRLVDLMHEGNVVNRNLTSDAIWCNRDGKVAIVDFGLAFYSDNEELQDYDKQYINGIKSVYQSIKKGQKYSYADELVGDALPEPFDVLFSFNGRYCSDWQ